MIPPDGLYQNEHYPDSQPVLTPKASAGPLDLPAESMANMDRVYWVLILRKELIDSGNLIETDEMRKEFKKLSKAAKTTVKDHLLDAPKMAAPAPLSAAVRTPAGDYVPPPDRKSLAAGEKDDEPDTPF